MSKVRRFAVPLRAELRSPTPTFMLGYYNIFPPKSMNVSVQDGKDKKKILVAEKDFEPGDVIYKVSIARIISL